MTTIKAPSGKMLLVAVTNKITDRMVNAYCYYAAEEIIIESDLVKFSGHYRRRDDIEEFSITQVDFGDNKFAHFNKLQTYYIPRENVVIIKEIKRE